MPSSKRFSIRSRILTNVLFLAIGVFCAYCYWPEDFLGENIPEWKSFTSMMGSVAATMVGFLVAVGALLYAVANTPLVSYLRQLGVEKRILFDLFSATLFWLICLFFSIFANFPKANLSAAFSGIISYLFAICGLLSFLPIGYSLWMILSNLDSEPGNKETFPKTSDKSFWERPTEID